MVMATVMVMVIGIDLGEHKEGLLLEPFFY
jgi:hypothetical protein